MSERGWEPFHDPKSLAMAVASEAGELAAELRWIASADADTACREPALRARVTDEAADVAITLLMFCDRVGIDLRDAIGAKLEKNRGKYPTPYLPFEDRDLAWIPLAGRRALDHAGLRLSLEAWQQLPLHARMEIVVSGAMQSVDVGRVRARLADVTPRPTEIERATDPPEDVAPDEVVAVLEAQIETDRWRALGTLARYAMAAYARRGKRERVAEVFQAMSSGRSQSRK